MHRCKRSFLYLRTLNALLRLTGASGAYGAYTYSYDAAGNRLSRDRDGVVETYSYALDSQRLAEVRNGGGLRSY